MYLIQHSQTFLLSKILSVRTFKLNLHLKVWLSYSQLNEWKVQIEFYRVSEFCWCHTIQFWVKSFELSKKYVNVIKREFYYHYYDMDVEFIPDTIYISMILLTGRKHVDLLHLLQVTIWNTELYHFVHCVSY